VRLPATILIVSLGLACGDVEVEPGPPCARGDAVTHPRHAAFAQALEASCRRVGSPGCVAWVARPGEPPWVGATGLANLSTGARLCVDTPLRVGSVSKPLVATLAMGLVDDGVLALGTTLAEALPRAAERIPAAERITVDHLLSHRSGIRNPESQDVSAQIDYFDRPEVLAKWTLEERLQAFVYDRPLLFEPGAAYRYSNPGYDLLGLVVEARGGAPLDAQLEQRVRAPLGLTVSSFARRDDPAVPPGYARTAEGLLRDVTVGDLANVGLFSPSGGLVSTVEEVGIFFRALFDGRVLQPSSLAHLRLGDGRNRRGLFEYVLPSGTRLLGHQGALIGQSTWALHDESEGFVVVVSFTRRGSDGDLDVIDALLAVAKASP
jgi:D-alanyl-D-alanine carboxypeptidase